MVLYYNHNPVQGISKWENCVNITKSQYIGALYDRKACNSIKVSVD